jgi:hypothetical protein
MDRCGQRHSLLSLLVLLECSKAMTAVRNLIKLPV